MPLVLGIDEAGYGPVLGPLVIGATLWRVPPRLLTADWWETLGDTVVRAGGRSDRRLPVDDSKAVFDRKRGLASLERSVLAFAQVAGVSCETEGAFFTALGFSDHLASACPWYHNLTSPLPHDPARSAHEGAADRLAATMSATGLTCCGLRAEVLTEDAFNRRVGQTHNKATVVVEAVLRLIAWAGREARTQDLHVQVDRLGGRAHYRTWLMPAFPERHVHVVDESEPRSAYRLASADSDWHIEFAVDADRDHLPVALASMVAKYVRELVMARFNAYWQARRTALAATAGYYTDAQRFLADLGPLAGQGGVPRECFVRAR